MIHHSLLKQSLYFGIIIIFGSIFGDFVFAANIQKPASCVSSVIFDKNTTLNGEMFVIRKGCPPPPSKTIPSILQEHTGVSNDGKIRVVQPKNSMENVRKRFHRMKRQPPGGRNEKERRNFQ